MPKKPRSARRKKGGGGGGDIDDGGVDVGDVDVVSFVFACAPLDALALQWTQVYLVLRLIICC